MSFKELDRFKAALEDTAREPEPDTRPRVVVVDDDPHVRASLELLLRDRYRVEAYANATEGVSAIDDDVDTVILDVKMSGIDGFRAYKEMREKDIDIPIIFYSAYQDIKDPYEIMNEYRPFGYITKGSDHGALLRSIEAAIAQRARASQKRTLMRELETIQSQMEALRKRLGGQ